MGIFPQALFNIKKAQKCALFFKMVLAFGLEPKLSQRKIDFESIVSTNFTMRASTQFNYNIYFENLFIKMKIIIKKDYFYLNSLSASFSTASLSSLSIE